MTAGSSSPIRVGCSGWHYDSWRGVLYPDDLPKRRWLEHYAARFDTVEINATFYRLPSRSAVSRWAAQTPPGFCFAIKVSRYLTHVRRLTQVPDGLARLGERIEPLREARRLGPLLWQLPDRFPRDEERLEQALEALPPGRHAYEFRDASWFTESVYALLRAHDAALVLAHRRERALPRLPATAGWRYVRLHHGSRGRRGNYSPREIAEWARTLRRTRGAGPSYVYFNNDWEGFAPRNASRLRAEVAG